MIGKIGIFMRKFTKTVLFTLGAVVVAIVLQLNYESHFSDKAIKGKENIRQSKYVKLGMSQKDMLKIMGQPDTIIRNEFTIFCYDLNDLSYGYGQIFLDSAMTVKEKYFPK